MKAKSIPEGSLLVNSAVEKQPRWPGLQVKGLWQFPVVLRSSINRKITYPTPNRRRQYVYAKPFYYVLFFGSGNGTVLLNNDTVKVSKGRLLLVGPGEPHSFDGLAGETAVHDEVVFEFRNSDNCICKAPWNEVLAAWFGRDCAVPHNGWDLPEIFHGMVKQAFQDIAGGCLGAKTPFHLQFGLARILSLIEDHLAVVDEGEALDPLNHAHHLVMADTAGLLTLTLLAEAVGLSSNYLSRTFKARYGITPMRLQMNVRLQAANNLLRTTNLPVKAIAADTGFSSPQHFIRTMKEVSGKTPGELRSSAPSQGSNANSLFRATDALI